MKTHTTQMSEGLTKLLADTYTLYLKTQNFHWNVKGMHFYALHKMFEEQYQELATAIDEIAERIRALGSIAPASFFQFMQLTSIKEDTVTVNADEMIKKLLNDHEILAAHASAIFTKAEKAQDEGTADLLIQRLKAHEKTAWMLKSTLS